MNRLFLARVALSALLVCAACVGLQDRARAQTAPEMEFVYRFQPRDTLIQLSRRLLLQPGRWPELQTRNRIANPFNIPPDTPIRIPYSWLKLKPETAQVQTTSGTVTRGGTAVAAGEQLAEGVVVETGADGSVTLGFADGSTVTLQKASVLRLEQMQKVDGVADGHSVRLELESGRAESKVKPKRDVGRFEIATPVAVSAVRGTQFRVGFSADSGNATTETTDGTVNVAAPAAAVAVHAGFGTRVEKSGSVLPPTALLAAPDVSAVPELNTLPALDVRLGAVAGAVSYRVQIAPDAEFHAIAADIQTAEPVVSVEKLGEGEQWLRARAIDQFGLEGADAIRKFSQHLLPSAPGLA